MDDPTAAAAPRAEPLEPRLLLAAALADVRIDGDFVVWSAFDGHDHEIFAYGGEGLRQLTDNAIDDTDPQLDGSAVVWQGKVGSQWEIYTYDLLADSAPRRLTDNDTNDTAPQIAGDTVIWLADDGRCDQVVRYDLATGGRGQLSSGAHAAKYARVAGGNITWYAIDGTDDEIYLYNDTTGTIQVTDNTRPDKTPRVSATHVVWRAYDGNDDEIYLYDIESGETTQVTDNAHHDGYAGLTDGSVVWAGNDGNDYDIYAYDIDTENITALTDNDANDWSPTLTADGAVWIDGSTGQIWRYDDATGSAAALTEDDGPHASLAATAERAVWIRDDVLVLLDTRTDAGAVWFTPFAPVDEPLVWIEDAHRDEGNGPGVMHFTVRLNHPTDHAVTLSCRTTADGNATAGQDYETVDATVTFLPGDVARSVAVPVLGDLQLEQHETFSVTLSDVAGAVLTGGAATGTILDDDTPDVSILDATVEEGGDGTAALPFTVRLSQPIVSPDYPVTLRYSTVAPAETADGLATPGEDYAAVDGEAITFAWGAPLAQTITISVAGDTQVEPYETLAVRLSDVTHAHLARADAVATIENDDTTLIFHEDSLRLTLDEGAEDNTTAFAFTVTLAQPSALPVTVDWATAEDDGATNAATAGEDYLCDSGTLTFAAGETARTFTVTVTGDDTIEPDETFAVLLSNPTGATIDAEGGRAVGVISDDDAPRLTITDPEILEGACRVSIYDVTAPEGDTGDTTFVFALSLSQAMDEPVTVTYDVRSGSAVVGEDLSAPDSGTVTFGAGETDATISVNVHGDTDADEATERFTVALTDVTPGVLLDRDEAVGRIVNDDRAFGAPKVSVYDLAVPEGDVGERDVAILVRCLPAPTQSVFVEYDILCGSAGRSDFGRPNDAPLHGTLTFSPDVTDLTIPVTIYGDTDVEPDERFTIRLTRISGGASLGDTTATVTIVNDDDAPALLEFTVRLDKKSEVGDVTVNYATALDDRTDPPPGENGPHAKPIVSASSDDFIATDGTLTFTFDDPTPVLRQTLRVPVIGELAPEDDETLLVRLSGATNAKIFKDTGVGTIVNDDTLIGFDPASLDVQVAEGDSGITDVTLHLLLSHVVTPPVSVRYITVHGDGHDGTDDDDYATVSAPGSEVTFAKNDEDGTYRATITVQLTGDATIEADETFTVGLIDPTGGTLDAAAPTATVTILDDDTPLISIADASVNEGDDGESLMEFTVQLSKPNARQAVTVDYRTDDDSPDAPHRAIADEDYATIDGMLTFPVGETRRTFTVPVAGDTLAESNETFRVILSNADGAILDDGDDATTADRPVAVGTILNDDTGIRIDDVECIEGTGPDTTVRLTAELTEATTETVTVWYTTGNGTATLDDDDYIPSGDMITFEPGRTKQTIDVAVKADRRVEPDETFAVILSTPTHAVLLDDAGKEVTTLEATVTIIDDDQPWLSITDTSLVEGHAGGEMCFTVTLTGAPATETITVGYTTADDGDATHGATADIDYAFTSGTLDFAPDVTSAIIKVPILDDDVSEPDETFTVTLSAPNGVKVIDGTATGTIRNDDAALRFANAPFSTNEGNEGTTNLPVTVELIHPTASGVTVTVETADGSARAGDDYTAITQMVTFEAGERSKTVPVEILGDTITEDNETFEVRLVDPDSATIDTAAATVTIVNDDAMPRISVAGASVLEGDVGTTRMRLKVTLSNPSALPISAAWQTHDGPIARGGTHYEAVTDGTVTFGPGDTEQWIEVFVYGDTAANADAVFTVTLADPVVNAVIGDGQASATIRNDDTTITLADAAIDEGDAGQQLLWVTVSLSAATAFDVSVDYATSDNTAAAGEDYTAVAATTLTFAHDETTRTIAIPILGDLTTEADETFFVDLTGATNAVVDDARAIATIRNNDPDPRLYIDDATFSEADGTGELTVRLSHPSDWPVTVAYATADESARAGNDYIAAGGTLTFDPGTVTRTISVRLLDDGEAEADELFWVTLSDPAAATLGDTRATAMVLDDDQPVNTARVSVAPAEPDGVVEGDTGTTLLTFDVTLDRAVDTDVTVQVATMDGSARAGDDYRNMTDQTLTFTPNETRKTVTVLVWSDVLDEDDETLTLALINVNGAAVGTDRAIGRILDDDHPPHLSIADASLPEGDAGEQDMTFLVTLSAPSGRTVTVDYATTGDTATAAADYIATAGTLVFEPGETDKPVTVPLLGDGIAEADETFAVVLSEPVNATIADGEAVGTIVTDDAPEPRPDLAVALEAVRLPATTIPADRARVVVTIANTGEARALGTAVVRLYASADGALDATDTLLGESRPVRVNLPPGRARRAVLLAVVPDTLPVDTPWHALAHVEPSAEIDELTFDNNLALDAEPRTTARRFGALDGRRGITRLSLPDPTGTTVTYTLARGGWGEIVGGPDGQAVALHDTSPVSALIVGTRRGARAHLAGIAADGPVGRAVGRTTDIAGDVMLGRAPALLILGDVRDGTITLGDRDGLATVRLGNVTDASLTSAADLRALIARSWRNTDDRADRLAAPSLGRLVVNDRSAGDFHADLDLATGRLGAAVIRGDVTGRWTAGAAGSIVIRGSLIGGDIELNDTPDGRVVALGRLVVSGDVTDATIRTAGSMGRVQVRSLHGSRLLAGVGSAVDDHPRSRADLVESDAEIRALRVTGVRGSTDRFVTDSHVAAGSLGVINLLNADFAAGGGIGLWADGQAARPIRRVVYLDRLTGERWRWPVRRGPFAGPDDLIGLLA
ncbi:MAG: Calx-beta domain-containing protein [Planctomycetota bacterium]